MTKPLPEVIEVMLAGKLSKSSLRAAISDELDKREVTVNYCGDCGFNADRSERMRCDLHGRGISPKDYCSWWKPRDRR